MPSCQTAAPEILKSAAHAMKHSEQRQGSSDYDQESDDRLVKAAYEFNIQFATGFAADAGGSSGEGGQVTSACTQECTTLISHRHTALYPLRSEQRTGDPIEHQP